jgi:hypothetical protein
VAECLLELGFPPAEAELRALLMLRAWVGGYLVPADGDEDPEGSLRIFLGRPG